MLNEKRMMGLEPTTYSLGSCRSSSELHPLIDPVVYYTPCDPDKNFLSPKYGFKYCPV